MKAWAREPACWLAGLVTASLVVTYLAHHFQPVEQPDTIGYREFDWTSVKSVLSDMRTPGYPLFLRTVEFVSDHPSAVPFAQWLALVVACLIFYRGIVQAGYRRSTALFAAGVLMFSRSALKLGPLIITDSLAISLAIAAAGFFFATMSSKNSILNWAGLATATLLTYLTRPAYIFLIPLWPVSALVLDHFLLRRGERFRQSAGRCLRYVAATVLPFLLYCVMRWLIVGHFGIVSFGGFNLVGVTGQFLEPAALNKLSADVRPIAETMLRYRAQMPNWAPPGDFLTMESMYNPTVWGMAVPAAREIHGNDDVAVNNALSQLGKELLFLYPRAYFRWLVMNSWHAVAQVVQLTALDRGCVLLWAILLGVHFVALRRGPDPSSPDGGFSDPTRRDQDARQTFQELHLLCWFAVAFAFANGLLVVLVQAANDRYMSGAMTFLPAAIAVCVATYAARVVPTVRVVDRRDPIQKQ